MKNFKILTALLVFFTLLSCNDDDKTPTNKTDGEWELYRVSGGLIGVNQTFTGNMITWKFNSENHTLVVVNNNTNGNLFDGLDSGTYSYEIVNNPNSQECEKTISIDNQNYGCISIIDSKLIINDTYTDGFQYELNSSSGIMPE